MEAAVCISFQIMLCTFFRSMKGFSYNGMQWHGAGGFRNSESGMGNAECGKCKSEVARFGFGVSRKKGRNHRAFTRNADHATHNPDT